MIDVDDMSQADAENNQNRKQSDCVAGSRRRYCKCCKFFNLLQG